MKIYKSINEFSKEQSHPTVVTIGNFDGCHKGHELLLTEAKRLADEIGAKAVALTFSPSPKEFFGILSKKDMIFTDELKALEFEKMGMDFSITQPFDPEFSKILPFDFLNNELINKLNAKALVVGQNFRFGYQAQGDSKLLEEFFASKDSFKLKLIDHEITSEDEVISSTVIRKCISNSELNAAKELLDRPHIVSAKVAHGKKLGSTIGFPTANLSEINQILPKKEFTPAG